MCLKPETWSLDKGHSGIGTGCNRGPVWLEVRFPWWRRPRTHGPIRARSIPMNSVVPGQINSVGPDHRAVRVIVVRKIWPRILDLHRGDVSTQRNASGTTEKDVSKRSNEVQGHDGLKRYGIVLTICIITLRTVSCDHPTNSNMGPSRQTLALIGVSFVSRPFSCDHAMYEYSLSDATVFGPFRPICYEIQ